MIDRTSLLTQFLWRCGFNSRGLKWICMGSSSADVRCSRAKFDQIRRNFVINPTLIGSQSSLNAGRSWRTQDLAQKLLNSFTIQSMVEKQEEHHRFLKGNFRENCRLFDCLDINVRQSWRRSCGKCITNTRRSGHDHAVIGSWSRRDHGPRSCTIFSFEINSVVRWRPSRRDASRCVHVSPPRCVEITMSRDCPMKIPIMSDEDRAVLWRCVVHFHNRASDEDRTHLKHPRVAR